MNGCWIRALDISDIYTRCQDFWPAEAENATEDYKREVLALVQDRLKTLADLPGLTAYFFAEPASDWSLIDTNKQLSKLSREAQLALLTQSKTALENSEWTTDAIQATLNQLLETTGQKPGTLFSLIRTATTWAPFSPQLNDTLALLGKDRVLGRLDSAIRA
jgi:glutamyl-tRNA synthetase